MSEKWERLNLSDINPSNLYEISSSGKIKCNSILLPDHLYHHSSNGYDYVMLETHENKHYTMKALDDLVGFVFVDKPADFTLENFHIEHIDGNKNNINSENLIWVKNKEFWVELTCPIATKSGLTIDVVPNAYKISNTQRVYSNITHTFLKPIFEDGYFRFNLVYALPNGTNERHRARLHRIMAESFHLPGKSETKNMINHINGKTIDCDLKNMEWVSNKENVNHAFTIGLEINPKGESHPRAKFSNIQRECIYSIIMKFKEIFPAVLLIFIQQRIPQASLDDIKYAKQILKTRGIEFPILKRISSKEIIKIYNDNKTWIQPLIDEIFDSFGVFGHVVFVNKYKDEEYLKMKKQIASIKDDNYNIIKNDVARIRAVPTMYISSLGEMGVFHLCKEIIDNNYDECYKKNSPGNSISIKITEDEITTSDNGRGIPTNKMREVFETMQAGSNMEKAGGETRGVNGAGSTCVLALSSYLKVVSLRTIEKKKLTLVYKDAVLVEEKLENYDGKEHGLTVTFRPSKKALGYDKIPVERLKVWLKDFNYTLPESIHMEYTINNEHTIVEHRDLHQLFNEFIKDEEMFCKPLVIECNGGLIETHLDKTYDRHFRVKAAFVYSNPEIYHGDDIRVSWMNTINMTQHGSHMDGCINGFIKYMTKKVYSKNKKLEGEDLKKDVLAHLNVVVKCDTDLAHMFSSQAKDRVFSKALEKVITETIFNELDSKYIAQVGDMVEVIVGNHRARIEGEKARSINSITRDKKKWTQPDQFYPCSTVKTDIPKEIFLCEGDSAGGGLKLARDAKYQALLTFKGKSLNVAKGNVDEVRALQSMPLENLTNCLGCGIGPTFDIRKLKYPNILIATDADIDGYHIRTILLTFFLRFMPDLIREGHVYVIEPPLYELRQGKKMLYVASQKEYADTCIKSIGKMVVNLPKTKHTCDAREFVREAFDYRSNIVAASYERFVNRYLLEYIADGFVKYGTVDNFIEHINDWIRSLCKIYSEIGFDDKTNQLHATIDLVDQVVVIDDKLMESLSYVIEVLKKHGLLIKEMENNKCVSQTTLLRFFEHIEDGYPKIVQRYKGLGSSQPIITREFVTDPRTRRAIKITMNNVNTFTRINDLMGDSKENVRNRKELLMDFPFTKDMLDN